MTFVSTDPNTHQSENTWFTPKLFTDELGPFDLDPCTVSYRPHETALKHIERDRGECGLEIEWPKKAFIWMNPPYGKEIHPFIEKFKNHGNGIALVFARMGTPWMQDWISSGGASIFSEREFVLSTKTVRRGQMRVLIAACCLQGKSQGRELKEVHFLEFLIFKPSGKGEWRWIVN